MKKRNKTEYEGIYYHTLLNQWVSHITIRNKTKCLGIFNNKEDAKRDRENFKRIFLKYSYSNSMKKDEDNK